jgi:hypothetical protein
LFTHSPATRTKSREIGADVFLSRRAKKIVTRCFGPSFPSLHPHFR